MAVGWELSEQLHGILMWPSVLVHNTEAVFVDEARNKTATGFVGADFKSHMNIIG